MKNNYSRFYLAILFFVIITNLKAQCTFTSSVPYYENFAGVTTASPLPQCWSSLGQAGTSTLGTGTAFFYYNPASTNYFFTRGIQLNAGVNYSTSIWYLTNNLGSTNWSNLNISLATAQSSTGLTSLASISGTVIATAFTALSNTFSVSQSGLYYFAISATSNGALGANYLVFDDFAVTAPCNINPVNITVTPSSTSICQGASFTLTASGANTYTWANGTTGSSVVVSPVSSILFNVLGTNTLTGCTATGTVPNIIVNPSPIVSIFTVSKYVCLGSNANLTGVGANTYTWSNGVIGNTTSVSPTVSTTYTVTGANQFACKSSAVEIINVLPLPIITSLVSNTFVCASDQVSITLNGAANYSWYSSISGMVGSANPIVKQVSVNEKLIITGTDNVGCTKTFTLNLNVNECAGLNEKSLEKRLYLFPNPTINEISLIGLNNPSTIEMFDLKGANVLYKSTNEQRITIDLKDLDKGMYILKIQSGFESTVRKIIKE